MKPEAAYNVGVWLLWGVTQIDSNGRDGIVPDHGRYGGRQNDDL